MSGHLSADEISKWVAGETTAEGERHLRECVSCSAELDQLQKTFALFRESGRRWSNHWYVNSDVPARRPGWRLAGALAACAAACLVLLQYLPARGQRVTASAGEAPFLEMPYVAPLAPYERAEVVRMEIPVAALAAAGFEIHVPDTGAMVLADVVVGQDGRTHAIRLVSNRSVIQ